MKKNIDVITTICIVILCVSSTVHEITGDTDAATLRLVWAVLFSVWINTWLLKNK